MTKVAIWCRHTGDNIIGIGAAIPWHVKSDFQRFRRITEGQTLVAGQKTYESFPGRTLPNRKIFVLTDDAGYEVADEKNHTAVHDIKFFSAIKCLITNYLNYIGMVFSLAKSYLFFKTCNLIGISRSKKLYCILLVSTFFLCAPNTSVSAGADGV